MKKTQNCKTCQYMNMTARARVTGNNFARGLPRGSCVCKHPEAVSTFNRVCPRSPRMAGFIGYTALGGNTPQIKTAPRWCPLRQKDGGNES